jgi:hypothetical protein
LSEWLEESPQPPKVFHASEQRCSTYRALQATRDGSNLDCISSTRTTLDGAAGPRWFATTHWSVVLAAGSDSSPAALEALGRLCRTYWYPLYAYARRRGSSPHDAEDLVQGFFARLMEKEMQSSASANSATSALLITNYLHRNSTRCF